MIRYFAALLLAFGQAAPAAASPDFDLGPAVGTNAPGISQPMDAAGKPRALESLKGDKGHVLFFFRAASWCPYCQARLIDLNGGVAEIEKRGYRLAGISYEPPMVNAEFGEKRGIKYALLRDPKSEIIDRFGLRDPQYLVGSRAYGVPRPVIFILDRDGVIKAKLYEETYKTRPPVGLASKPSTKLQASEG